MGTLARGYDTTMKISTYLMRAARAAVRSMVDLPNRTVSLYFPRVVFE